MEFKRDISNLPYRPGDPIPTHGLASVTRDQDALYLDFLLEDQTQAVRIAILGLDAPRMLAELRRMVDLLAQAVPDGTATDLH